MTATSERKEVKRNKRNYA